jgi:phosphoglycolate phosphatase-like HAD superfamily hydrolase
MDDLVDEASSSSADAKASKPEADTFAAALEKVMMRAEQAVALGDTPWDAQAAGKLGIPVVGLTSGDWKVDDLRRVRGSLAGSRRPPAQLYWLNVASTQSW